MNKESLGNLAKAYVGVIEKIEKTSDPDLLVELEELRSECHHRFMQALKREGIRFKDREHVTRIAYRLMKGEL